MEDATRQRPRFATCKNDFYPVDCNEYYNDDIIRYVVEDPVLDQGHMTIRGLFSWETEDVPIPSEGRRPPTATPLSGTLSPTMTMGTASSTCTFHPRPRLRGKKNCGKTMEESRRWRSRSRGRQRDGEDRNKKIKGNCKIFFNLNSI